MKHINLILTTFALMLMFASCGSGGDEPATVDEPKVELRMIVQAPDAATRIADPGTGTGEADTWDTFVLAFVYKNSTTPTHTVVVDKLTREQFEKLEKYNESENVRYYSVQLAKGVVYCYGVVYSSQAPQRSRSTTASSLIAMPQATPTPRRCFLVLPRATIAT